MARFGDKNNVYRILKGKTERKKDRFEDLGLNKLVILK